MLTGGCLCGAVWHPRYAHADERPQVVVLRVGTLDEPQAVRPAMTIWTDSAPGFVTLVIIHDNRSRPWLIYVGA